MTKTMTWVLITVILVAGGIFAFNSRDPEVEQQIVREVSKEESVPTTSGKKIAFSELVKKQDGAYKCTVKQYVGDVATEGTTYINAGMISGKFNSKVNNMDVDSSFVVRDGYSYTWSSLLPNIGFKSKVNATAEVGNTNAAASGSYTFNAEQIGDYDCQPWTVDESVFVVPTNITFKDTTQNN